MRDLIENVKRTVKYWWISLIIGVLALIVGIWSLVTPIETFFALTILFVVTFFIEGILEIAFSISNRKIITGWGWNLAMGIIDVIFAIILMRNMALTPLVFSYVIAFWVLFRAVWGIGVSIDLKGYRDSGWGWLLALSIIGVIIAILMLLVPTLAASFAVYMVGFALIVYGIFRIYLAFRLKGLKNNIRDIKKQLED
ncbi:HdeD family acid-resistance protein [Paludibacter sp. 221]|uniref:HdeD family acid-resistance protein n=1 Tax=Paludibacter sp. 221 TaxID=2302939 RepID=UPI0013D74B63|nr:HdeD family acid-resistance protein [Paludibacter sp. 221]NDV47357.1 HdeD family acid-resistance protein [Paludibacter sp. 221]